MTINEKISILRHDAGLSQDELAEKLNVSRQSVSKWESGKALPDTDKLLALSELFNVSTDFLLKDSEDYVSVTPPDTDDTADDFYPDTDIACPDNSSTDFVPPISPDSVVITHSEEESRKKQKKKIPKWKIITACISIILVIALIIPLPLGLYEEWLFEEYVEYPYVMVHGLGGYGSDSKINESNPYWGSETGNVVSYLRDEKGYDVYEASVGPFSSTWDRTCELYAQLTGTTVDYGEAHSKAHNHERYGRTYTEKLAPDWGSETKGGQVVKLNLVGHSFGGATIRQLTSLLEYGNKEEIAASGDSVSPLFKGGQGNLINSVTTLCSPHNGSTLYYCVEQYNVVDYALDFVFYGSKLVQNSSVGEYYDFHLEHFGIDSKSQDASTILKTVFSQGTDNAAYDLSPDGAAEINKNIKTVDNVYYFSYAYSMTESKLGKHVPAMGGFNILTLPSTLIGSYSKNGVTDYPIDETWLENDGMVNVISARYPFEDKWQEYDSENIVKGKWNVMPTLKGHHGTVVGMDSTAEATQEFYTTLFTMIDEQPRDKKYYFKGLF